MKWNGEQVKQLRQRMGWCTANFARRLNCSQELVLKWESGEQQPESQYYPTLQLLHDSAETNAEQSRQRTLAERLLKEEGLDQITKKDIDRLTEES